MGRPLSIAGDSAVSKDNAETHPKEELQARLSGIETRWTTLFQAHASKSGPRMEAQKRLMLRYYGAVYRYLLGTLHDPDTAEELTQEFAVRFLRGDFRNADPGKGRFRDFLKAALRHLAHDHWRKEDKKPQALDPDKVQQVSLDPLAEGSFDQQFLDKWREELLSRTWEGLRAVEARTGQPYLTVLQRKSQEPQVRSAQLAEELSHRLNKPFSEVGVRQILHRARDLFADLLVDEVAGSLGSTEPDEVEEELIDLDLLSYCQKALDRRKERTKRS
jgi:RNA polymerase sigma-70 factor (ECF subfamily)